jgi:hypothetical protein
MVSLRPFEPTPALPSHGWLDMPTRPTYKTYNSHPFHIDQPFAFANPRPAIDGFRSNPAARGHRSMDVHMLANRAQSAAGDERYPLGCLTFSLLLTAAVIGWLSWSAYRSYGDLTAAAEESLEIEEVRGRIERLDEILTMSTLMAAESGEANWEQRYRLHEPELTAAIERALELATSEAIRSASRETEAANRELVEIENEAFVQVQAGRRAEAKRLIESPRYVEQKALYKQGMVRFGEGLRESSAERSRRAGDLALWNLRVGLSTLPILLMGWLLAARMLGRWRAMLKTSHEQLSERTEKLSNLVRRVQSTAQGVAASSAQLLATQRSLDAMARRQSESTHSIAASTTQIAASSQQLMRTIEGVDVASSEAATAALASRRAISDVGRTMDQMVEGAGSIAGQLESIREESGKITALISAITAVADQTNLLSLNAAIEAEKAGQLGRGFSVVAREMRTLADRTAISILQIEGTVGEVRNAVAAGAKQTDLFSAEIRRDAEHVRLAWEQLASIITRVESIARQIGLVRSFATEQATGATNIRDAMHQLGEAARITAQSLNESRLVVENLNSEIQIRSYAIEAGRRYRGRSI